MPQYDNEPYAAFSIIVTADKAILSSFAKLCMMTIEPVEVFDYRNRSEFMKAVERAIDRGLPTANLPHESELARAQDGKLYRKTPIELKYADFETWDELERHSVYYKVTCYEDKFVITVCGRNIFNGLWNRDNYLSLHIPKEDGLEIVVDEIGNNVLTRREIFAPQKSELRKKRHPQKHFMPSPIYSWIRSRQLEGTMHMGKEVGVFQQTCMRVVKGWGSVPETRCPYPGETTTWPFDVPAELDEIAKHNCCPLYARVCTLDEALLCLASVFPISASFKINIEHWHNAADGHIAISSASINSAHSIFFYAYSQEKELLYFQNSWGDKWGEKGHGTMTFEYFSKHLQEAFIVLPEQNTRIPKGNSNSFSILLPTGHYDCVEVWESTEGIKAAWIIIRIKNDGIEIDDLFVRPEYRRRGLGENLLLSVIDMAKDLNVPVESWISIANTESKTATLGAINALCNRLNFKVKSAKVGWARFHAIWDGSATDQTNVTSGDLEQPGCSLESLRSLMIGSATEDVPEGENAT